MCKIKMYTTIVNRSVTFYLFIFKERSTFIYQGDINLIKSDVEQYVFFMFFDQIILKNGIGIDIQNNYYSAQVF